MAANSLISFYRQMGPSWVVSAVACGPGTMASVAAAGAGFGYRLLWVVVLSAVLASGAQYLAAQLGMFSGRGLIRLTEEHLGPGWAWFLTVDAAAATWLAAAILMRALSDITGLITGYPSPFWGVVYAALIYLLSAVGGYRVLESVCKALVAGIVLSFLMTLFMVRPDPLAMLGGLVPRLPGGLEGAFAMAGIMGGAVHVTILTMHSYNLMRRGWGPEQAGLAFWDVFLSMFVAFGLYSVAVFLAGAAVLHPQGLQARSALDLAGTLKPLWGPYANAAFLAGAWGAVVSTVAPLFPAVGYIVADRMGWPLSDRDRRVRGVILVGLLISLIGPFFKGGFVFLLMLMLALGLCGTPPAIAIILILLGRREATGGRKASRLALALGVTALVVTAALAGRFVLSHLGLV